MPKLLDVIKSGLNDLKNGVIIGIGTSLEVQDYFFGGGTSLSDGTLPPTNLVPVGELPIEKNLPIIQEPINNLVPIPDRIYRDPFTPVLPESYEIIYPNLPDEKKPKPPSTLNTTENTTYTVRKAYGLKDKRFGSLLFSPFINVDTDWCYFDNNTPDLFWLNIFDQFTELFDQILNNAEEKILEGCELGVALFPLPFMDKNTLLLGCDTFLKISRYYRKRNYQLINYLPTGLVNTGKFNFKLCSLKQEIIELPNFELNKQQNLNPCLEYELSAKGKKPAILRIVWVVLTGNKYQKQKTNEIPFCDIDKVNPDNLKKILPKTLLMGKQKFEFILENKNNDLERKYSCTAHFGSQLIKPSEQLEFVDNQYLMWINELCISNTELYNWKVLNLNNNNYNIHEATYFPYQYLVFDWLENENKNFQWCCIKKGNIYRDAKEVVS